MKYVITGIIALLLVSTVAATMLIKTDNKAAGYNNAAYYVYQEGEIELAQELYMRAIDEDSSYQLARYNLATLLFEIKEFQKAAKQLELLVVMNESNVNYKYDLAVNLVEEMRQNNNGWDRFDEALNLYYEVEEMDPGFAFASENIVVMERILSQTS